MQPETAKLLYDIRKACDLVEQFTSGKTFDEYRGNVLLRSAVERQLMIVGEALFQGLKVDPTLADSITNTRRIIGFRHVIVHGYGAIADATVWGIVQDHLPLLRREVEQLFHQLDPPR